MVTAMGSTSKISINIQKSKKLVSYSRLTNMPKTDINGRIYDVASIFMNLFKGKNFLPETIGYGGKQDDNSHCNKRIHGIPVRGVRAENGLECKQE